MSASAEEYHKAIEAEGIPIKGVSVSEDGQTYRIQFNGATKAQETRAAEIADGIKGARPRRRKALAAMITEVNALSAGDKNKLITLMTAVWLLDNPKAARAIGVALDGDEEA